MSTWVVWLFGAGQLFAGFFWLLMVFAAASRTTERIISGWWYLGVLGVIFVPLMAYGFSQIDVFAAFANTLPPTVDGVYANLSLYPLAPGSWTHYTVLDLVLGRWLYLREVGRGPALSLILVLTYAAAPAGLVAYVAWKKLRGQSLRLAGAPSA